MKEPRCDCQKEDCEQEGPVIGLQERGEMVADVRVARQFKREADVVVQDEGNGGKIRRGGYPVAWVPTTAGDAAPEGHRGETVGDQHDKDERNFHVLKSHQSSMINHQSTMVYSALRTRIPVVYF